ncbi:MAG: hypothetical protein AMXMBFR78_28880 [Rubrivivax sp.]
MSVALPLQGQEEHRTHAAEPALAPAQAQAQALPSSQPPPEPRSLPSLSCVLPCLNEARNLRALLPALVDAVSAAVQDWEIVVVDDGSTDATPVLMAQWADVPGLRCLRLSRNFGKEAALTAGLEAAAGEVVVTMDADGQHDPELIAELIARWRQGADMVYTVRRDRQDEPLYKRLGTGLFYRFLNAGSRFQVPAGAGDFRLMDRRVVAALLALPERNRFMKGLYAWVGFRCEALPYTPAPRANGRSRFGLARLVGLSLDGLTAFTTWPLRAVTLVGYLLALLAFGYGAFLTASYLLFGHLVSGWTTIVVGLMLFSGLQLVSLGIVGEYVARIFEEVKRRPLYVLQSSSGKGLGDRAA